ncbi:class I adenylate-forming enzyme family protein [Thermoflavimicrobium dichotomicum]|uniref:Acyl-CoA synthetase (AMP-forming)/AMP-acid ligase II n=1 Tax=Thermoflavimicrobium dichotomicum TaxID=46223 RepID=A0A1I3P516_9BACL|nr:class I adenylate-forming enzyme family protein [Thermoflavimicrobium dichotomicum]SFJ16519.1 Acyl-CoA synthetase (AMP-forming)/AMP-acid ligase II [Thermoflavimicrobium dichotomicum]
MKIVYETHFNRQVKVYKNRPKNLTDMLRQSVESYPQREALVMNGRRITYLQLWEKAERMAGNLYVFYGVRKGDRIALLLSNSLEFVYAIFACARLGAIAVTLNTRLKEDELSYMLNHSGAKVLITDEENVAKIDHLRKELALPGISHFFLTAGETTLNQDYLPFEILEQKALAPDTEVSEDDALFIMYTSGTTGLPKGAIGSHLGAIHSAMNYEMVLKTTHQTKTLIAVPLFHVTGLIGQLLHMIRVGGTSVIMKRFKSELFIRLISEENITFLFNVPAIYVMMLAHPDFPKYNYHSVNCIAYGGAPMSEDTISALQKAFPGVYLHNAYGATETSSPATLMPQVYAKSKMHSVGLPVPVADVKVVDSEGNPCRIGEVGELLIKGPMVVEGYWDNEEANRKSFIDGYWRSGDMAKMDEDGFVYIMDRMKDMINRGGEKIFSVEVENVLYNHPKVLEAAVVGAPHDIYGEVVAAFIVPKAGAVVNEEEIRGFVAERLADYKVPAYVEFISELPRNPGGKVIKTKLKELWSKSGSNR